MFSPEATSLGQPQRQTSEVAGTRTRRVGSEEKRSQKKKKSAKREMILFIIGSDYRNVRSHMKKFLCVIFSIISEMLKVQDVNIAAQQTTRRYPSLIYDILPDKNGYVLSWWRSFGKSHQAVTGEPDFTRSKLSANLCGECRAWLTTDHQGCFINHRRLTAHG